MNIPEETPEEDLTAAQRKTRYEMLDFLDELTMLTRRTCIVVTSQGNVDVPTLRKVSQAQADSGRYVRFWETTAFCYPEDIIWDNGADDVHLINFDRITEDEFTPEWWTLNGDPIL